MLFTREQRLDDGVLEREFTLGQIPGVLWTPPRASAVEKCTRRRNRATALTTATHD